MACVLTTTKEFKNLTQQYGTSAGIMELAINSYLNENLLEEYDSNNPEFIQFINNYFKLGDTNIYENKSEYEAALKVWENISPKFEEELSQDEANALFNTFSGVFDENEIIIYETDNNNYKVRVAKPILITSSTSQNRLDNRPSLLHELNKLKAINHKISAMGANKNLIKRLKRANISPFIRDLLIEGISKYPNLRNLTPHEALLALTTARDKDIASEYNKLIQEPVNRELEKFLTNYLSKYNIDINIGDAVKKFGDVTGVFDILNKIIYVAKDRNKVTFPEEFAHAFVELMGSVTSKREENKDFTFLMNSVEGTSLYKQVYEKYSDLPAYLNADKTPNVYKIKKEAIGQALATSIINNFENKNTENTGFWDKLRAFFDKVLNMFKDAEYIDFNSLINTISKEILANNTSRLDKIDSSKYKLLNYWETLENQNKKDGGKALAFMQYFTKLGNIITGSLSYRLQGTLYRSSIDSLHDIDMVVPSSVHGIEIGSMGVITLMRQKRLDYNSTALFNYVANTPYFQEIQKQYPKLKLTAIYPSRDNSSITVNAIYAEDTRLSERFISLTGSYADRLERFSQEERDSMYLFDFFLESKSDINSIEDTQNNLRLSGFAQSFQQKLFEMGRAKDIYDYQMWKTYDEFKDSYIPQEEHLMYQTRPESQNNADSPHTEITYTPKGKQRQTYTIKTDDKGEYHIYNKNNKEVFLENSKDRRKILANYAITKGDAVVVTEKNTKYVVYKDGTIISVITGDEVYKNADHGTGKNIRKKAEEIFKNAESITTPTPIKKINKLQSTKQLIDRIIERSRKRITFEPSTHTYYVDGKPADLSASQFANGEKEFTGGAWGLPSSLIGITADTITRDFFNGSLKSEYPNMTKELLEDFVEDLNQLKEHFDVKFGKEQYGIITEEFPIAATITTRGKDGKPQKRVIAGTMDMLIYDSEGNFHIYDMKTFRSSIEGDKLQKYTNQLNVYKDILEASNPELRGRIVDTNLIQIKTYYPAPVDFNGNPLTNYLQGKLSEGLDPNQLYIAEEGDLFYYPLQSTKGYSAPRLAFSKEVQESLLTLKEGNYKAEFAALTTEEKSILADEFPNKPISRTAFELTKEDRQRNNIFNSKRLPARERTFLANSIMKMASLILGHLQQSSAANEYYFPNGEYSHLDFTTMSREELLDTVNINAILKIIKDNFFDIDNVRERIEDPEILSKLELVYLNWGAIVELGNPHFIKLEGRSISNNVPKLEVKLESGDESFTDNLSLENIEENTREYWTIGLRQLSAKSGLSAEIRRAFEKLPVLDKEGNPIYDDFGYGIPLYVDSDVAVNYILDWVKDTTSIEEMESILEEMKDSFPWVSSILEVIKEEPFRSQFYNNFRKDFTKYSIMSVQTDEKGNRTYVTNIINTKGAVQTILDELSSAFKEGVMSNLIIANKGDIEGRGRVNTKEVDKLITLRDGLYEKLFNASKKSQGSLQATLKQITPDLLNLLIELGIHIDSKAIEAVIADDLKKRQYDNTITSRILKTAKTILDTLDNNKDNTAYNPLLKDSGDGNLYNNYSNIVKLLSKYIQDSIETSTYENGKMYYSFSTPSYLLNVVRNLSNSLGNKDKFDNYLENNYGRYRWFKDNDGTWNNTWLNLLDKSPEARANFEHKVQLSFEGKKGRKTSYDELSEIGYTMSLMNEFFYDKHKKWAWYRVPILSDKPSSEFIKFKRYHRNYKRDIGKGMQSIMDQEIMRIQTVLERAVKILNTDEDIRDIKNFDAVSVIKKNPDLLQKLINKEPLTREDIVKNGKFIFAGTGAEFKFLDMFNQNLVTKGDVMGDLILKKINRTLTNEDAVLFISEFTSTLNDHMDTLFEKELAQWQAMGLFETETVEIGKGKNKETKERYKYLHHLGKNREEIEANLMEYMWNDMFATMNIIQLTVTDLAYYKNVEDFQKRFAQVHSPTMKMNVSAVDFDGRKYSADGLERTLYIEDLEIESDIIAQVKYVFYDKVEKGEMSRYQADTILAQYGYSTTEKDGVKYVESILDDGKKILIKSGKVNVTDAQGYSSPTSYRKKMGMLGRWTPEMDEAYETIKSGNWNGEDLGVLWQPLKPFVYTQISKTSGAETMSELKVPVQNKNSEYLLIMADAILKGGNRDNKLSAIFDFMEDSAYTNGIYNGKGIDTVLFATAVKSGLMGVIDINEATTKEEVLDILNNEVYIDQGDTKVYNNQTVHEIPFEDYGIQQEVPPHLADHKQVMGTQMRILSISDIGADAIFNVHKESEPWDRETIINTYQNLIAANIKDSFNTLIKEFNLGDNKIELNKAISKLLLEEMEKDQKYGADLRYAVTLNSQGEFNVPLSDPIHSVRIQQLLNSIIKSRINKLVISGGPVVLASVYGVSEDLRIVWKGKNGKTLYSQKDWEALPENKRKHDSFEDYLKDNQASVDHFEVYMPIPSLVMEKALTKEDGTLMDIEEALKKGIIHPEQLKAIGYRIPTEDKYSMAPMKIKGFLPKSAGEAIMLPKEITLLSGSDFDIDKIYVMVKDFMLSKEQVDYDAIREDLLKDSTFKALAKQQGTIAFSNIIDRVIENIEEQDLDKKEVFEEDSAEMYVFDKIFDQKLREKYTKQHFFEKRRLTDREGRNNRIFDIQWAILTNSDTSSKMFNPGSFDVLKKTARIVSILKDPNNTLSYSELSQKTLDELNGIIDASIGRNISLSSTLVYLHKQNMTAAKLIGIAANNNTSHAFLSMQNISFNIENPIIFDGVEISNTGNNKLDNMLALDGKTLISKNIAGYLAASVDAVKDPVLNFMNLNTFTANVAMTLARLGYDSDSIGLFLTQPVIESVTKKYFVRSNEGYVSPETVIEEMLKEIEEKRGIKADIQDLTSNSFTKKSLAENIKKGASTDKRDNVYYAYQTQALLLFKELVKMGQDLNTLTFLTKFNSVSNAVGPTIADTLVIQLRYNKFQDRMAGRNRPFSLSAIDVINNSPILKAFYETTVADGGASQLIFEPYFPHYSGTFKGILNALNELMNTDIDSKLINLLVNDYIVYKLTVPVSGENNQTAVFDGSFENRNAFINNFVARFRREAKGIIDNELIDIITIKGRDEKVPVPTLQARTGGYNADVQERIKNAWSELINNPETRELGIDLFFYNMFRSGFSFSPKTFMHLASVDVKQAVDGYIDSIRDVEFNDEFINGGEFLLQFKRNHSQNIRLVPELLQHPDLNVSKTTNVKKEILYEIKFGKNLKALGDVYNKNTGKLADIITYENNLLMLKYTSKGTATYVKTTPLGNPNNFLEYNANEVAAEMQSALINPQFENYDDDVNNDPNNLGKGDITKKQDAAFKFAIDNILSQDEIEYLKTSKTDNEVREKTITLLEQRLETEKIQAVKNKIKELIKDLC